MKKIFVILIGLLFAGCATTNQAVRSYTIDKELDETHIVRYTFQGNVSRLQAENYITALHEIHKKDLQF